MGLLCDHEVESPSKFKLISAAIGNELKSMIVTGVLPCLKILWALEISHLICS